MSCKITEEEFWVCDKCSISSETNGKQVPCKKRECEGDMVGKIVTAKRLFLIRDNEEILNKFMSNLYKK